MQKTFYVPFNQLKPQSKLHDYLKAIGFPLANNVETKQPDSVIRTKEGWKLTMRYDDQARMQRVYVMETVEYKERMPNDL